MIVASGRSFARPLDVALAEAIPIREALSWLKSSPFGRIIVEIDSMQVFQAISDSQSAPNYFGYAIDDCKHLLQTIPQCRVIFERRSVNSVAHALACASYLHVEVQPFICDLLCSEVHI